MSKAANPLATVSPGFMKANPEFYGVKPIKADGSSPLDGLAMKGKKVRQKGESENKTEKAFRLFLEGRSNYKNVIREGIGIRLGNGVVYWPDYTCVDQLGRTLIWEVKGFMRDDAAVKIKVAAGLHPEWTFVLVSQLAKKDGGGFEFQEIKS